MSTLSAYTTTTETAAASLFANASAMLVEVRGNAGKLGYIGNPERLRSVVPSRDQFTPAKALRDVRLM